MRASLSTSRVAALVTAALAFGCTKVGSGIGNGSGSTAATVSEGSAGSDTASGSATPVDQGSGSQAVSTLAGSDSGSATAPTPPPPEAKNIDSKDILARGNTADDVFVKLLVVPWKDLDTMYGGRLNAAAKARSNADAAALATELVAKLGKTPPDQIDAIVKEHWDLPGPPETKPLEITPDMQMPPPLLNLALRLNVGEAGVVNFEGGYLVVARIPPPAPDPLESADILARPAEQGPIYVQHVLIGYKDAPAVENGRGTDDAKKRTKADADKLAKDVADQAKGGADFKALMKKYSEDPGSKDTGETYTVDARARLMPTFKKLSLRLKEGEVGLVLTDYGWHVIKRVPPPPADPLESTDILKREPVTQSAKVKHILLGWTEVHAPEDEVGAKRSRADLDKLVKDTVAKLKAGAKIEPLMAELSADPGSAKTGDSYPVTPDAGLVEPFKNLSLRLKVGEVGVVKSQFGIHIIQRIE